MCNLETEVLENLICGVLFCFFLKRQQRYLGSLSCVEVPGWVLCGLRFTSWWSWRDPLTAETEFLHVPDPEDGEEGCRVAAPWRRLALVSLPDESGHALSQATWLVLLPSVPPACKAQPAQAVSPGCVLHSAVLWRPAASAFSSRKRREERCPPLSNCPPPSSLS